MSLAPEPLTNKTARAGGAMRDVSRGESRFLPTDILSDRGRIFRPSLRRWAPSLTARLHRAKHRGADPGHAFEISGLCNNASLLFALAGESEFAEAICTRQIAWLARRAQTGDGFEAISLAIQPWVNIGRLERQRGQTTRALAQFTAIFPDGDGQLAFGPFRLAIEDLRYEDVELIGVIDSLRTLWLARDYERGLRFVRRLRPRLRSAAALVRLDEYAFQLHLALGHANAAVRVLESETWARSAELMLINAFYRCLLLDAGNIDCTSVLADLARWTQGALAGADAPDHCVLRYALDLARLYVVRESHDIGAELIAAGYRAATRHEDVPLRAAFARLAASMGETSPGDIPTPEAILLASDYVALARQLGIAPVLPAESKSMLEDLRAALGEILG